MELINSKYSVDVDLNQLISLDNLHEFLKKEFGFFEGYGANIHALIDCLSSIRYKDDGMLTHPILKDESIVINLKGVEHANQDILYTVLLAVGQTNKRYQNKGMSTAIYIAIIN